MAKDNKITSKYISPSRGYFEISKYNQEGKLSKYRLLDELTSPMTQNELAEFYEIAKKAGNPLPLNLIKVMELLEDTANSENNELKNYVHESLRKNWISTLTRAIHNPIGEEGKVIHNYGTQDAFSILGDIEGKNGWIKDIDNQNALELLLKTKDIKNLNEISNAINSTPMYFWRVNSKPSEKVESVAGFYADVVWLGLVARGDLSSRTPAFLVKQVE